METAKNSAAKNAENKKFEPIEYEEELNFSLQTPKHLDKGQGQGQDDDDDNKDVTDLATTTTTTSTANEKENLSSQMQQQQQQQQQQRPQKEEPEKPVQTLKSQHQQQQQPKEESEEHQNTSNQNKVTFKEDQPQAKPFFPLLPPPPPPTKIRSGNTHILRPTPASPLPKKKPVPDANKSKSLPRGLPSDFSDMDQLDSASGIGPMSLNPQSSGSAAAAAATALDRSQQQDQRKKLRRKLEEEKLMEDLELEAFRARFEYEELMALKSELERRKVAERKEMDELREELATMQTLYQYRTYSVDSSDSSSDNNDSDNNETSEKNPGNKDSSSSKEEIEELTKVLSDLMRDNKELETKKEELCKKIQEERAACVNLRVEIRVEQERKKMKQSKIELM